MDNHKPTVRIICRQEQLRDSLRVLLASLSRVEYVQVASDLSTLIQTAEAPPALVLFAVDSSDADSDALQNLQQIKLNWPDTRVAVLVENEKQYRVVETAGVDIILFKGTFAAQLLRQIDELLPQAEQ